jgi:hypothetical protein
MGHTTLDPHIANDDQLINWLKSEWVLQKLSSTLDDIAHNWNWNQIQQNSIELRFNCIPIQLHSIQEK